MNDLAQIGSHNKREKKAYNSNPNIKLELSKDNIEIVPLQEKYVKGFKNKVKDYEKEHNLRMKTERPDRRKTFNQMLNKSKNVVADEISFEGDNIVVGDKKIKVYAETDPNLLPWKNLDIDIVLECTGKFTSDEKAMAHINAGAKKVIISAPAKGDVKTIVYNVNHDILDGSEKIISAASCTTNCLAPVLKVLDDNFGIKQGYMTTVHAYTNDQATLDVAQKKGIKARRGRASAANIVPASTGAASAIGKVLPNLEGKMEGAAMRVPVTTGSVVDLVLKLNKNTTVEEINETLKNNTNETLGYTTDPIVSSDTIGMHYGSLVDSLLTSISEVDGEQLVKVVAWYDNEMSYTAQYVRVAKYVANL